LGDIVICPEAAEREHAPAGQRASMCLVLAHGFLHLLGWDHDTPEKELAMWERQGLLRSKLLTALKEVS
jgi:probable rRNA maturation factor